MLLGKFICKRTGTKIQPWQSQVEKCPPFKKPENLPFIRIAAKHRGRTSI
jgi:hypothetical protein